MLHKWTYRFESFLRSLLNKIGHQFIELSVEGDTSLSDDSSDIESALSALRIKYPDAPDNWLKLLLGNPLGEKEHSVSRPDANFAKNRLVSTKEESDVELARKDHPLEENALEFESSSEEESFEKKDPVSDIDNDNALVKKDGILSHSNNAVQSPLRSEPEHSAQDVKDGKEAPSQGQGELESVRPVSHPSSSQAFLDDETTVSGQYVQESRKEVVIEADFESPKLAGMFGQDVVDSSAIEEPAMRTNGSREGAGQVMNIAKWPKLNNQFESVERGDEVAFRSSEQSEEVRSRHSNLENSFQSNSAASQKPASSARRSVEVDDDSGEGPKIELRDKAAFPYTELLEHPLSEVNFPSLMPGNQQQGLEEMNANITNSWPILLDAKLDSLEKSLDETGIRAYSLTNTRQQTKDPWSELLSI